MEIVSYSFLFISSLFATRFLSITQYGADWEIPSELLSKGTDILGFTIVFLLLSLIMMFIAKCSILKFKNIITFTYVLWVMVVLIIIISNTNHFIYNLTWRSKELSEIFRHASYPGIIISLLLFDFLILMNKKYSTKPFKPRKY